MDFVNPFTPAFGSMPQHFFGRTTELRFVEEALDNPNSPHRAFFVTGSRGSGKTTLLEKTSQLARRRRWLTIDVHSTHASKAIISQLAGGMEKTTEKSIDPSVMGVTVGHATSRITERYDESSLAQLLVTKTRSLSSYEGICITVDEIQKVPEHDAENICASVQLAMRKGLPVVIALAGLPGAKEKVASYPGCTFMQRAHDMRIGSLIVEETIAAFRNMLKLVPQIDASDEAVWEMGAFSEGYPYLMQLVGYYIVGRYGDVRNSVTQVEPADVEAIEPLAMASYRANVLDPVLGKLSGGMSSYLSAMCSVEDDAARASCSEVAGQMGKTTSEVSSYRQRLITQRLIEPAGRGYVRFLLPHVRDYYLEAPVDEPADDNQYWNRIPKKRRVSG